jgi:hypothetical protein
MKKLYYAETARGAQTGKDCDNTVPVSFVYNPVNFGCGANQMNPQVEIVSCPNEIQRDIVKWLREQSAERMREASARRCSDEMRNSTLQELKDAKKLAEKMAGRKLSPASLDANKQYCDMQDRIANKLEVEAKKLSEWADYLEKE